MHHLLTQTKLLSHKQTDIVTSYNSKRQLVATRIKLVGSNWPANFIIVDIASSFWHESHTALWFVGLEGVKVMHERRFFRDLKVTDYTVTLEGGDKG